MHLQFYLSWLVPIRHHPFHSVTVKIYKLLVDLIIEEMWGRGREITPNPQHAIYCSHHIYIPPLKSQNSLAISITIFAGPPSTLAKSRSCTPLYVCYPLVQLQNWHQVKDTLDICYLPRCNTNLEFLVEKGSTFLKITFKLLIIFIALKATLFS